MRAVCSSRVAPLEVAPRRRGIQVSVIAITGSASGIGAATRKRVEAAGRTGVGGGLRGRLDGLVVCAGVGPHVESLRLIVSLNYFGAQALLVGLRDLLANGTQPAAVAVSSNSSTIPGSETPLVDASLAGNEDEGRHIAAKLPGHQ